MGNSSAVPAYGRNLTSQLIKIHNHYILIDCGEGTQQLLLAARVNLNKIRHILISHLHGDHYFGLVGLLSTMHLFQRPLPLHLYGPPELLNILSIQFAASETTLAFDLHFHPLDATKTQQILSHKKFTIDAFPLKHRLPCCGFRIMETPKPRRIRKEKLHDGISLADIGSFLKGMDVIDDKGDILYKVEDYTLEPKKSLSYAFCSDTIYDPDIVPYVLGVDLLYHEATFTEEMKERASHTMHSTAKQAASIAKAASVGKLILGHFSIRYEDLTPLLNEAKEVFLSTELSECGKTWYLEA